MILPILNRMSSIAGISFVKIMSDLCLPAALSNHHPTQGAAMRNTLCECLRLSRQSPKFRSGTDPGSLLRAKKLLTGEHKDRSLSVFKPSSVSSFCFSSIISQPSADLYSVRDFKYAMAMLSLKDSTTRSSSAASLTISGVTPIASAISSYSAAISSSAG